MVDRDRRNPVAVPVEDVPGLQLDELEREPDPARGAQRQRQQLAQPARAMDRERLLAPAQIERLQEPGSPSQ